jgi:hypothetical protein
MPRGSKSQDEPSSDAIEAVSTNEQSTDIEQQTDGPKIGDLVICTSRLPSPLRPWEHPIWIGVIEQPGTDPSRWNGKYSEAAYCVHTRKVKVRYRGPDSSFEPFIQHDKVESLIVLSEDEVKLTGVEAIRHFLGLVAAHQYERHQREQAQATSHPAPETPVDTAQQP